MQVFWKYKCFGNISQLETRPMIGWPSESTNQRPGFQLTCFQNTCTWSGPEYVERNYYIHLQLQNTTLLQDCSFMLIFLSCSNQNIVFSEKKSVKKWWLYKNNKRLIFLKKKNLKTKYWFKNGTYMIFQNAAATFSLILPSIF